ncbi:MAG TPA: CheR family methyltransferase, partial [Polyangia bacterium]
EPYSVAILLDELLTGGGGAGSCRIFATDSCEAGVAAGRAGVYAARAVQNLRRKHLEAYFTRAGDSFTVIPRLRDQVDFSTHDLLDAGTHSPPASIYGHFNLILCCNLLIYYRPEFRQRIIEKLLLCLAPGGYLVLGETERAMVEQFGSLRAVAPPAPVFQKG